MKLGIVCTAYTSVYGLERGTEMLAKHGYTAVDFQALVNTEEAPMKLDEAEFKAFCTHSGEVFRQSGIEVSQAHGPWRYPPRDFEPSDREERFGAFCKAVRGTSYLGCKYIVVHPLMPFGADSPENKDELYEINFDFYTRLCAYAKDFGVTVCLENMPFFNLPISSPKSIAEFVKAVGADNFKVCLDTGHANVFGIKQSDAIKDIGKELLKVLHIHDNDGKRDLHFNPFEGTTDWADFGQGIANIGFDGVLSLETEPKNKTEESYTRLAENLKKIYNFTQI